MEDRDPRGNPKVIPDSTETAITKLIESAQSTARQARQDASPATTARTAWCSPPTRPT